jgi:prepilin signal peptidase PulO-like enzyme (type II secretory pathway)
LTTIQFLQQLTLARDVLLAVIGLFVGSFLNVLALRSLKEQSIIFPPSHCPNCDHRLGIMDLVPVLSYLMLRGRCRYCHQPISWQYPIVEVLTAAAFVILIRYFGFTVEGVGMVIFACTLIAVCVTDFREKLRN